MSQENKKERLKRILVESKEEGAPEDLEKREVGKKLEFRKKKANTIAGMRRTGKTYLMFQLMKKVGEEKTFYINFEDERIIRPTVEDLSNLLPLIKETFEIEPPIYLLVDEIQNVEGWEKWARRISEKSEVILMLSGSSSHLTSQGIATSLRGRTLTTYLFPLNFREFLEFKEIEYPSENIEYSQKKPELRRHFKEYLKYGGLPEIVLEKSDRKKMKILQEYFSTVVARDLVERHSIGKIEVLENFIKLLVNNFSRRISFSKAQNWLSSMGIKTSKSTLIKYFKYVKESFFLFDTTIFSRSVKDREQYPRKIYVIDNGFITALTERFESSRGWYSENKVAVNLYRKTITDPKKELHYWRKDGKEVDFVVKNSTNTEKLIQVCSEIHEQNKEREVENLLKASEDLKCKNLLIITDDYRDTKEVNGKQIVFQPLWQWLLERKD